MLARAFRECRGSNTPPLGANFFETNWEHAPLLAAGYLTADTHFEDADCKLMDADWPDPRQHVKQINHLVKNNDTVVHLGDVGNPKYIHWLDGARKILILGNHDAGATKYEDFFDEIYAGPLIIAEKIILSHEPVDAPWALNIHGHDHRNISQDERHLNCASNVAHYLPINLKEVILSGALKKVDSIHRIAINAAREHPLHGKNEADHEENRDLASQNEVEALAFTEDERKEIERVRSVPITFDGDCPETTPERAIRFHRVNPVKTQSLEKNTQKMHVDGENKPLIIRIRL